METIDFNTVIAENISVVEGLIGTVNLNKNGLMSKGQNVFANSSGSMPANSYMYLCKVNTNPSYIDIFLTHTYRSPVRLSVTVAYEPGKAVCGKSFVIGTESLAELYYNIVDDGCELYVKNLQSGPMVVAAFIYKGVFEAPMSIEELPTNAIKF